MTLTKIMMMIIDFMKLLMNLKKLCVKHHRNTSSTLAPAGQDIVRCNTLDVTHTHLSSGADLGLRDTREQ